MYVVDDAGTTSVAVVVAVEVMVCMLRYCEQNCDAVETCLSAVMTTLTTLHSAACMAEYRLFGLVAAGAAITATGKPRVRAKVEERIVVSEVSSRRFSCWNITSMDFARH